MVAKCGTRLVKLANVRQQPGFRPTLAAIGCHGVIHRVDIVGVEHLAPHRHDDAIHVRHRDARYEVLTLGQLGDLVAPGVAPGIGCLNE